MDIGKILRKLCEQEEIKIIKTELCLDHIHMLIKIPLMGYYVNTVGKNTKKIAEYICIQLQDDIANDQLTLFESIDPFTEEKYKKK